MSDQQRKLIFLLLSSEKAAETFIMSSLRVPFFGLVLGWYLLSEGGLLLLILRNFLVLRNLLLADFLEVV